MKHMVFFTQYMDKKMVLKEIVDVMGSLLKLNLHKSVNITSLIIKGWDLMYL